MVTGGAGFFGEILTRELVQRGCQVVVFDRERAEFEHPSVVNIVGDVRSAEAIDQALDGRTVGVVFHLAALLAHDTRDDRALWDTNVEGTRHVAEACARHGVGRLVFTSSNCLWGVPLGRPITEEDLANPVDLYGQTKQGAEAILHEYEDRLDVVIIRCPTIISAGRLGLLAILFEFIDDGCRVWVVGDGSNRYQFIHADDLARACLKAAEHGVSAVFNIGSDNVKSLREVYQFVIDQAGGKARVAELPKRLSLLCMRLSYRLGISPLGPYHYKMIAESFIFDTTKIKRELDWSPTLTNEQMLLQAYQAYSLDRQNIESRCDGPAHKKRAKMGLIRLLKWIS